MVLGSTVSANVTAEVNEPMLRGLGTRIAASTSVGVECDRSQHEPGVVAADDSKSAVFVGKESDSNNGDEDDKLRREPSGWRAAGTGEPFRNLDPSGRILPKFLPFITWLRISLRSSALNWATSVLTTKRSSGISLVCSQGYKRLNCAVDGVRRRTRTAQFGKQLRWRQTKRLIEGGHQSLYLHVYPDSRPVSMCAKRPHRNSNRSRIGDQQAPQ